MDLGPSPDLIVNAIECLVLSLPEAKPPKCAPDSVRGFTFRFWVGMTAARPALHLRHWMPRPLRIALFRLRLSMSDLRVDKGRHARPRVPRHLRLCMAHSTLDPQHDAVEDLQHFLLECPAYDRI